MCYLAPLSLVVSGGKGVSHSLQVFGHQVFVGFGFFRFLPGGVDVGNGFILAGSW
jgi:hypothetical protein